MITSRVEKIQDLHNKGLSERDISRVLVTTTDYVHTVLSVDVATPEMLNLAAMGVPTRVIAKAVNLPNPLVIYLLNQAGKPCGSDCDEFLIDAASGMNNEDLAFKYNITRQAVHAATKQGE